jgi:hypothetical protein
VVPVAKVPEPGNFRPISILPALSKALQIIMRDQIVAYLTDIGALSPLQSGFRSDHSTVMALMNIKDDIYGILDQEYFVALVLLDFSKAFDSIDCLLLSEVGEPLWFFVFRCVFLEFVSFTAVSVCV